MIKVLKAGLSEEGVVLFDAVDNAMLYFPDSNVLPRTELWLVQDDSFNVYAVQSFCTFLDGSRWSVNDLQDFKDNPELMNAVESLLGFVLKEN